MKKSVTEWILFVLGLLACALVVLKISGIISWTWWWVFSPIWMPIALVASWLVFLIAISIVDTFAELKNEKRQRKTKHL